MCSAWDVHWQSELDVCGIEACDVFWMMVCDWGFEVRCNKDIGRR